MPIVSAVCPSCGAQLDVDNGKDAGICKYCGNAFITENAINNYNIKYEVKADTVIMNNRASMDELLEREEVYSRLNEIKKLTDLYEEMIKLYPKRYEGWWGKILLLTGRFNDLEADISQSDTWFGFVRDSAPADALPDLEKQYNGYLLKRSQGQLAELNNKHSEKVTKLEQKIKSEKSGARYYAVKWRGLFIALILFIAASAFIVIKSRQLIKDNWNVDPDEVNNLAWVGLAAIPILSILSIVFLVLFFKNQEFYAIGACKRDAKKAEKELSDEESSYKAECDRLTREINELQSKMNT